MTHFQEFSMLLRKIHSKSRCAQYTASKDIAAALQEANKNDLQELLELLISTHDIEIQIKLFSILAAHLVNNGVNYDIIVKYNPLYETIQNLLVRGLPMKAAVVLNFLMALLNCDDGDSRSLATHARNMIRVSGCLNTMSDMFSGSMVYQDTWIALCRSLAESCRGSQINQNYCSHLVPLCVQRCRQGNVDVCAVLQSLLQGHERNLQLFISSDGLTIFTRQLLQYNMGIQLLDTIVEKSSSAVAMLRTTDVVHYLRDFLHLYGPHSQIGQWSTIILYHLDKEEKSLRDTSDRPQLEDVRKENLSKVASHLENLVKVASHLDCSKRTMENFPTSINDFPNNDNIVNDQGTNLKRINRNTTSKDDTTSLFQNVMKEVIYWKTKENRTPDTQFSFGSAQNLGRDSRLQSHIRPQNSNRKNTIQNIQIKSPEKDLTFSYLMRETIQSPTKQYSITRNDKIIESFLTPSNTDIRQNVTSYDKGVQTHNDSIIYNTGLYNGPKIDLHNFRPAFVSTPKRNKTLQANSSKITHRSRTSPMYNRKQMNKPSRSKLLDDSKQKLPSANKQMKYRSMSERFFSAINESCTTIVKSMKSIFRSKEIKDDLNDNMSGGNENEDENRSCSYSFTNYMRKRDALLEGEFSQREDSSSSIYKVDSCKTCRDTIVLQQKMKRDDHLKQTVRKLKMGINLYGCDFKKISHTMWPRDRYMTPEMLYNLYRKLIIKGGHDNHSFRQKPYNAIRKR